MTPTPENLVVYEPSNCDCQVCLVEHDDEIHAATLSLKEWFRSEVTKYLYNEDIPMEEEDSNAEWYLVA